MREGRAEPTDIEPRHAGGLAPEDAPHEADLAVVGEQLHDLLVQPLVHVVAVRMLHAPHGIGVFQQSDLARQPLNILAQCLELVGGAHVDLLKVPMRDRSHGQPVR